MFTSALLVTAKNWKQSKCPPIKQTETYLPTMEYYSAIKINKLLILFKQPGWISMELC